MLTPKKQTKRNPLPYLRFVCLFIFSLIATVASADELKLQELINEALSKNPEILAYQSKLAGAGFRIPQAGSLPDPMLSFGYQNEGFKRYTYGYEQGAQWMLSASQTYPYPGKIPLKSEIAAKDREVIERGLKAVRLKTIVRVKELFSDIFLAYKNLDIIKDRAALISRIEDAALARYSAGASEVQDVVMAQTEKYMLLEREEMLKQKINALEGMINTVSGRDINSPLGKPGEYHASQYSKTLDEMIKTAYSNSPEIKSRESSISISEKKVELAKKDFYPDFTLNAGYATRRGVFKDMWNLTTTINIPLYHETKQKQAVNEAEAAARESRYELETLKFMLSSAIRENHAMIVSAEKLMELYKKGLIPKTYQDFELALAGYVSGKGDAYSIIGRLKALIDYEVLYWNQFTEREKAIARVEAVSGISDSALKGN
ncbi:MAG: TolC family protein [Nitrospirae bacterium]|nr:MAG: TolC family protein [Nitrospirota bacterium]